MSTQLKWALGRLGELVAAKTCPQPKTACCIAACRTFLRPFVCLSLPNLPPSAARRARLSSFRFWLLAAGGGEVWMGEEEHAYDAVSIIN